MFQLAFDGHEQDIPGFVYADRWISSSVLTVTMILTPEPITLTFPELHY
jgi:hypothetical protein